MDNLTNIFVADYGSATIRKITPLGNDWVVTTLAGSPQAAGSADGDGKLARFGTPEGIALDKDGNLWVSDREYHTIRKLVQNGTNWTVTTIGGQPGRPGGTDGVGSGAAFRFPMGIAVDSSLNLYMWTPATT